MREMPPCDAGAPAASPATPCRASPSMLPLALAVSPRLTARRLLASAVLLAAALATPQARAQSSPGAALDGTTPPPGAVMMAPQMPRPGSSRTFEHGGAPRLNAEQRFQVANTTRDGHLTEAQAHAAHLRGVATHFAEIDKNHRGYVTFDEILTWRAERKAAREKAEK